MTWGLGDPESHQCLLSGKEFSAGKCVLLDFAQAFFVPNSEAASFYLHKCFRLQHLDRHFKEKPQDCLDHSLYLLKLFTWWDLPWLSLLFKTLELRKALEWGCNCRTCSSSHHRSGYHHYSVYITWFYRFCTLIRRQRNIRHGRYRNFACG